MTDELFLMAFCCINSDYTHLLLKATITAKSHLGKARPGRVSFSPPPPPNSLGVDWSPFCCPWKPGEIEAFRKNILRRFGRHFRIVTELSSMCQKFKPSVICTNKLLNTFISRIMFSGNTSHFIDPLTCLEIAKNFHIDSKTYLLFAYKQKK